MKVVNYKMPACTASKTLLASLTALSMTMALIPASALGISSAEANNEVEAAESEVTRTANAYDDAVAEQDRLASEISTLNSKIEKLEKELPEQEARSNDSCVALYKVQGMGTSMLAALLSAQSFTEAISMLDNYNYIITQNVDQMVKTAKMKSELEDSRTKVEADKKDADAAADSAAQALENAKSARAAAQKQAEEAQKAEEEAAKKEAAEKKAAATTSSEKKAAEEEAEQASESASAASVSNVDWSSDKQSFVDKWAPRIDDYLSGSPTAGTGKIYAAAAWDNGVDPRWAPAISCVESGKGSACFRTYNAWGYGGRNFSSWSEGIQTVVAALGSSLYGGALTKAAAQTYCPPTWQDWYNECASQMKLI